jgi:hypothetical protein
LGDEVTSRKRDEWKPCYGRVFLWLMLAAPMLAILEASGVLSKSGRQSFSDKVCLNVLATYSARCRLDLA